ncbi:MAG TPA: multidrug ABC transporter ATP-binding protein [Ruminococcaceae bacterium]|nr:multidrug ABC transporter ATP-binding protein [Oscillospiraceae bacterium]
MILEVSMDLVQPSLMSRIVDDGIVRQDFGIILNLGIQMLIFTLLGCVGGILSGVFGNLAAQNFSNDLRKDAFAKVMKMSFQQTDKFTIGSLVTRLTNDITACQDFVGMALRMMVRTLMQFIGGIVMVLSINATFGYILLFTLPVQIVVIILVLRKGAPLFSVVQSKLDRVNSVVQENVSGARVVKAYTREEYEYDRFSKANDDLVSTNLRVQKLMALLVPILSILMNASVIAVIYIGGEPVRTAAEGAQVGSIMAAITYITQILMSMMMIGMMFQQVTRATASASRIREVLEADPVISDGNFTGSTPENGTVEFRNVSFRYPGVQSGNVLSGVNFRVNKGETVAVLGATGCGKTSLVSLIPRFYDATEGEVLVDGVDVREYKLDELRHKIGFVLQKSELFSETIEQNIRWGDPDATDEEVKRAAEIAQADEFISGFTDGYKDMITEKGSSLSGGQKQRLSIARAIVKNPEILIFDDSMSALDLATDAKLQQTLREKLKGTTVIMIAQRVASVMRADKIAVIDNGTIVAFDNHNNLMKTCDVYRDIYNSQMREGAEQVG